MKVGEREFAFFAGDFFGGEIDLLSQFGDGGVDDELASGLDVFERVFLGSIATQGWRKYDDRRIGAEGIEEAEWREVDHAAGGTRRDPGDRPGRDEADEQVIDIDHIGTCDIDLHALLHPGIGIIGVVKREAGAREV